MTAPVLLDDRYELHGVLGCGGMAEVREGWDTRLSRAVAVKLLHPTFDSDTDRLRFQAEARSAAALNHPHIVCVHDFGEHTGIPFIVMERLTGRSLADAIAEGPLPQPLVAKILDEVLAALATAHHAGILHRDVKPGNILFTPTGDVKLGDFGLAKSSGTAFTATGDVVGTIAYLSPDRLVGRPATVMDDLYAVGVVGYEALSGRGAYVQDNPGALARAILDEPPLPIAALRPDVDPTLAAVVERAMSRDPNWRFRSADDMRAALSHRQPAMAFATTAAGALPPPKSLVAPRAYGTSMPSRFSFGDRKLLLAIAALAVFLVTGTILAVEPSSQSRPSEPISTSTPNTTPPPPPAQPPPPPPSPAVQQPVLVNDPGPGVGRNGNNGNNGRGDDGRGDHGKGNNGKGNGKGKR